MCNLLIPDFISHVAIIIIFCCGILVCYKYSSLGNSKKKQSLPLDIQLKVLKMAKRKKLELIILFFIIYTSIFFIQYLSWTPVGYDGILGVGARYFIPILAILPLVFGHKSNSEKLTKYFIVFTTIFLSGMLLIIIAGFY